MLCWCYRPNCPFSRVPRADLIMFCMWDSAKAKVGLLAPLSKKEEAKKRNSFYFDLLAWLQKDFSCVTESELFSELTKVSELNVWPAVIQLSARWSRWEAGWLFALIKILQRWQKKIMYCSFTSNTGAGHGQKSEAKKNEVMNSKQEQLQDECFMSL